jgi:hypothetical protein
MRVLIVCVLVSVALVECAPVNREELLQNIENAAQAEVSKAETEASEMQAEAGAEEKQIESNKNFANEMSSKVKQETTQLESMAAEEKQTIADAKAIEADAQATDVSDIKSQDQDAAAKSAEIQETAEAVDADLRTDIEQMRSVGIEGAKRVARAVKAAEKKASQQATLGQSQFPETTGSYKQQLKATEDEAQAMVSAAQNDKNEAQAAKEKVDSQLNEQGEMAKVGMQQLKKSEDQLHRDLNGHRDSDLEMDIQTKAEDIDAQGNSMAADDTESQESAMMAQTSSEDGASYNGVQPNFSDPTKLGESQTPTALEAAEMAAEVAVDKSSQLDTSAEYSTDDEATEAAAEYSTDESAATATGSVSDDYQAIGNDAEQLVAYQQNSLKEIEQIETPLQ